MRPELLSELLTRIKSVKIAIVGDFCLDAYWFIDEAKGEVSVETGQMTRPVKLQKYSLGGAGNVAANLAAMEIIDIRAFGVIGNDPFGTEMASIMKHSGIDTRNLLIQSENWSTHVYIKPYTGDSEQNRIDFGNFNRLAGQTADILISSLDREVNDIDLVIINQQVLSGIHTEYFRDKLASLISKYPGKIFIADSRNYTGAYHGSLRKMNDHEALRLCGMKNDQNDDISYKEVSAAAARLYKRFGKPLFITRGDRGSVISDKEGIREIPGLMIISRTDTVGAGDSYLSGVAGALAAGYPLETAAESGTLVAGVTVQKLFQTGTASPEEILRIGKDPDLVWHPDLAADIRGAGYHKGSEIEIISKPPAGLRIKHAVFDNDGTLSTLREGWENIMAPMMIKAVLGRKYDEAGESLLKEVKTMVDSLIDKTTGIQTLMQMKLLCGLVRECGFVPEEEILDEHGYKAVYNRTLMEMVNAREKKLSKGDLEVGDFTIKNALNFLKRLYDNGIKLYLTSGTDEADVKHEASVLGYDHFFEGRIFGSVGNINLETKKFVLDRLLDSIGAGEALSIATFGDGPVEIRETRKHGGLAVGVASNELRRHGLNSAKRSRLIKAGADLIIPDFSQADTLCKLLKIN